MINCKISWRKSSQWSIDIASNSFYQCEFTWNYNPNHALTWSNPLALYPLWIKSLGTNSLQCSTCLTNRRINHTSCSIYQRRQKRTKIMRGKFCPLFTCVVTLLDPYFHTHHVLNLTSIYCKMCVSKTSNWLKLFHAIEQLLVV